MLNYENNNLRLVLVNFSLFNIFNYVIFCFLYEIFRFIYEGLILENGLIGELEFVLVEFWVLFEDKKWIIFILWLKLKWFDGKFFIVDDVIFIY